MRIASRVSLGTGVAILTIAAMGSVNLLIAHSSPPVGKGYQVRHEGNWIYFDRRSPRRPADKIEKVSGFLDSNGNCQGGLRGSVNQTDKRVTEGVEVAFNPNTCESIYEIRFLTPKEVQDLRTKNQIPAPVPRTREPATAAPSSGEVLVPFAASSSAAYTESWFEDPPGWNVTWTRVTTEWSYNGTCVLSASGSKNWTKMTQTGWALISEDWSNTVGCQNSSSALYAEFKNGLFCLTIDTFNTYDRTEVRGEENGTASFYWPASKRGGCVGLLSHHYLTGFM